MDREIGSYDSVIGLVGFAEQRRLGRSRALGVVTQATAGATAAQRVRLPEAAGRLWTHHARAGARAALHDRALLSSPLQGFCTGATAILLRSTW
jgi:hypothetical protein